MFLDQMKPSAENAGLMPSTDERRKTRLIRTLIESIVANGISSG